MQFPADKLSTFSQSAGVCGTGSGGGGCGGGTGGGGGGSGGGNGQLSNNSRPSRPQNHAEMLSLARDLLKKSHDSDIKPLTVCFWSDFMSNPSVMYGLFSPTPRKLNWDSDKVKVMGTKDGMIKLVLCLLNRPFH